MEVLKIYVHTVFEIKWKSEFFFNFNLSRVYISSKNCGFKNEFEECNFAFGTFFFFCYGLSSMFLCPLQSSEISEIAMYFLC